MRQTDVKHQKRECAFCGQSFNVTISGIDRMREHFKRLKVTGGRLVISSYTNQTPICSKCWFRAVSLLRPHERDCKGHFIPNQAMEGNK